MPRYAAFLRAVNVGGRTVRMATLRELLGEAGLTDVTTYIQTGNVVFSSSVRSAAKLEVLLEDLQRKAFGFDVVTMVRTKDEVGALIEAGRALTHPGRHMISLCKVAPSAAAVTALEAWALEGERALVIKREIHAFYDRSYNTVKLPAKLEKLAGTPSTTREFRVVEALCELL